MYEFVRGKNICTMSHYFRRHLLIPLSESRPRYNSCNERCHAISQFRNLTHTDPFEDAWNLTRGEIPDIRRLARRGGVKRISGLIYEETRTKQ